jgi:hypothetical protein
MKAGRPLTAVVYATAALLILVPLGEAFAAVLPMSLWSHQWRFGAVGLFSRALMLPLVGIVLASYWAMACHHRRTLRALSGVAAVSSMILIGIIAAFALDSVQTAAQVNGPAKAAFRLATIVAMVKLVAVCAVTAMLARGAWVGSRLTQAHSSRSESAALLIGTQLPHG